MGTSELQHTTIRISLVAVVTNEVKHITDSLFYSFSCQNKTSWSTVLTLQPPNYKCQQSSFTWHLRSNSNITNFLPKTLFHYISPNKTELIDAFQCKPEIPCVCAFSSPVITSEMPFSWWPRCLNWIFQEPSQVPHALGIFLLPE